MGVHARLITILCLAALAERNKLSTIGKKIKIKNIFARQPCCRKMQRRIADTREASTKTGSWFGYTSPLVNKRISYVQRKRDALVPTTCALRRHSHSFDQMPRSLCRQLTGYHHVSCRQDAWFLQRGSRVLQESVFCLRRVRALLALWVGTGPPFSLYFLYSKKVKTLLEVQFD